MEKMKKWLARLLVLAMLVSCVSGFSVSAAAAAVDCTVYVDAVTGSDDSGEGTEALPYATLAKAYEKLKATNGTAGTVDTNKIVLLSDVSTAATEYAFSQNVAASIAGKNPDVVLTLSNGLIRLGAATKFDNLTLNTASAMTIRCLGQNITVTDTVTTAAASKAITLCGGNAVTVHHSQMDIYGGKFETVAASFVGNYQVQEWATVNIGGNAQITNLYGAPSQKTTSKSNVNITGGTITNVYAAGAGTGSGTSNVTISGGTVTTVYGSNGASISGPVHVTVLDGAKVGTIYAGANGSGQAVKDYTVSSATVTVEGGEVQHLYMGGLVGNASADKAKSNKVTVEDAKLHISGGTINEVFLGGFNWNDHGTNLVKNVAATITGGQITTLYYGGNMERSSGFTQTDPGSNTVDKAVVTLSGTVRSSIGAIYGSGKLTNSAAGTTTVSSSKLVFDNYCKSCGDAKTVGHVEGVGEILTNDSGVEITTAANNGTLVLDKDSAVSMNGTAITTTSLATITKQPQDTTIPAGGSATLEVAITPNGEGDVSYQWYENTENDPATSTLIEGATESTYTASPTLGAMFYGCQIGIPGIAGVVDKVSIFSEFAAVAVEFSGSGQTYVYVSSTGDDSNAGTYLSPVQTLAAAYALLPANGSINTNYIVIIDAFTDDGAQTTHAKYNKAATIRGYDDKSVLNVGGILRLNAELRWSDIKINGSTTMRCRGQSFTSGQNVTTSGTINIFGGEEGGAVKGTPIITIQSGTFGTIYAGSNNGNGTTLPEATIRVQGGNVTTIVGGCNSTTNGGGVSATAMDKVTIEISGGSVTTVYGGGYTGSTKKEHSMTVGKSEIKISGGTVGAVYAGGNAWSTYGGTNTVKTSVITISGGSIGTLCGVGTSTATSGSVQVENGKIIFTNCNGLSLTEIKNVSLIQVEQATVEADKLTQIEEVVFFDSASSLTCGAQVLDATAVTISAQPQSTSVPFGTAANLTVQAALPTDDATGTLAYQWFKDTADSKLDGALVAGQTGAAYSARPNTAGEHKYFAVVYNVGGNICGSNVEKVGVATESATVTVTPSVEGNVTYYVDGTNGNDSTGDGSEESPWKTIEKAKAFVNSNKGGITGNITVVIAEGTYRLDETLAFDQTDSGNAEQVITYKAADEADVTISGAKAVTGFSAYKNGIYVAQLPDSAKIDGEWPAFRDLLVNGELATRARTEGWKYFAGFNASPAAGESGVYAKAEDVPALTSWDGVELVYNREWYLRRVTLDGVFAEVEGNVQFDFDDAQLVRYLDPMGFYDLTGYGYWLENHLDFLNEAGEWYYDQSAGKIYYKPFADEVSGTTLTATVEYPVLEQLITFTGTSDEKTANITLDGFTFTGTTCNYATENGYFEGQSGIESTTDWIAPGVVQGFNAKNITIENCLFTALGNNCVRFMEGSSDITITSNQFRDSAMSAIVVGDTFVRDTSESRYCYDVEISNNVVHNVCMNYLGSVGILTTRTIVGLDIVHNTLSYLPYTGISCGSGCSNNQSYDNNIHIEGNWVENTMYALVDGAGIYVQGGSPYTDHTIKNNVVISNGSSAISSSKGIYLDCGVRNYTVENNVVLGYLNQVMHIQTITAQMARQHTVRNNWFTLSKQIKGIENAKTAENVIENNVTYASLADMPEEAKAVYAAAGSTLAVEDALVLDRENKHIQIPNGESETIELVIRNNTSSSKTYQVKGESLPSYVTLSADSVTVAPGAQQTVQVTLGLTADAPVSSGNVRCSLKIVDEDGHEIVRERIMSVQIGTNLGTTIYKYTPTVDGLLDDAYLNSAVSRSGSVFHKEGADDSDVTATAYLLWDEDWLYVYVQVSDPQVISRGTQWIQDTSVPYCNDNVETYYSAYGTATVATKYAVDAYGAAYYYPTGKFYHGDSEAYPFVAKLTHDGEILDYTPEYPVAAGTCNTEANGYVIEMAIPVTAGTEDGSVPKEGTEVFFHFQNNDLQSVDGNSVKFAALVGSAQLYTISEKAPEMPVSVDKTALKSAIDAAEALDLSKYQDGDDKTAFTAALTAAKTVYADANAKQTDVDAALKALNEAVAKLSIVYTITYDFNDKDITNKTKLQPQNPTSYTSTSETITLNPITSKGVSGKIFYEWRDEDGNAVTEIPTGSTGDIKLKAYWKYPVNYHFLDEDGNEISKLTEYFVEDAYADYTLAVAEDRNGCTFDGWYQAKKDIGKESKKTSSLYMTKKFELYGKYIADPTARVLTITYDAFGGEGAPEVQTYTFADGEEYTLLPISSVIPTREGYKFCGWSRIKPQNPWDADLQAGTNWFVRWADVEAKGGNVTLYAVWEKL